MLRWTGAHRALAAAPVLHTPPPRAAHGCFPRRTGEARQHGHDCEADCQGGHQPEVAPQHGRVPQLCQPAGRGGGAAAVRHGRGCGGSAEGVDCGGAWHGGARGARAAAAARGGWSGLERAAGSGAAQGVARGLRARLLCARWGLAPPHRASSAASSESERASASGAAHLSLEAPLFTASCNTACGRGQGWSSGAWHPLWRRRPRWGRPLPTNHQAKSRHRDKLHSHVHVTC